MCVFGRWPRTDPGDAARHGHDVSGSSDAANVAAPLPVIISTSTTTTTISSSSATSTSGAGSSLTDSSSATPTGGGRTGNCCWSPAQSGPSLSDCVSLSGGGHLGAGATASKWQFIILLNYYYHVSRYTYSVRCKLEFRCRRFLAELLFLAES